MLKQVVSSFLAALAALVLVAGSAATSAQPPELNTGFANVTTTDGSDCGSGSGSYCFGSFWGIGDLKATVAGNTNTLQPNFNTYNDNPGNAYWRNNGGAGPLGNKIFEGSLFYEQPIPAGATTMEFNGTVDANTIDAGYAVEAFVTVNPAVFPPPATQVDVIAAADATFSISLDVSAFAGLPVQAGFRVRGVNANPADEGALGSVVTTVAQLEAVVPPPPPGPTPVPALPLWGLLGLVGLIGFLGLRRRA